jgi:5-(carboxyamino)imidazole ribonucleotide synthase
MLNEAGLRLGLKTLALVQNAREPAALATQSLVEGSLESVEDLKDFLHQVDMAIFESEFVSCDKLSQAAAESDVIFAPSLSAIRRARDKLEQKQIFASLGIPTADFAIYSPLQQDLDSWLQGLGSHGPEGCILKWSLYGYDGKGNHNFTPGESSHNEAKQFCERGLEKGARIYAEKKIAFTRELAMICSHATGTGEIAFYPLVITQQRAGACYLVQGPATSLGVLPELERLARGHLEKIARSLDLVVSFAVEFFLDDKGQLLANELAPRVHNSAHFTQEACETDQFENHLRAVCGWPLGPTQATPFFSMINLLGPASLEYSRSTPKAPSFRRAQGLHLHWYGKLDVRPGRKLGHVNATARDREEHEAVLSLLEKTEAAWIEALQNEARKS